MCEENENKFVTLCYEPNSIKIPSTNQEIIFKMTLDGKDWFMKIINENNKMQIIFNKETYPDYLPDDFAKDFGEVISKVGFLNNFCKGKNEWISLKEKKPVIDQIVLVYCDGMEIPNIRRYNPEVRNYFAEYMGESWEEITHWMPLPELPED